MAKPLLGTHRTWDLELEMNPVGRNQVWLESSHPAPVLLLVSSSCSQCPHSHSWCPHFSPGVPTLFLMSPSCSWCPHSSPGVPNLILVSPFCSWCPQRAPGVPIPAPGVPIPYHIIPSSPSSPSSPLSPFPFLAPREELLERNTHALNRRILNKIQHWLHTRNQW